MTPAYTFMAKQAMEKYRIAHMELTTIIRRRLKIAENISREDMGMDSRFLLTGEMHYRHEDNSYWLQYTAKFGDGKTLEDCWVSLDPRDGSRFSADGLIYVYSLEDMVKGEY